MLRAIGRALPLLFSGRLLGALALWTAGAFLLWIAVGVVAFDPLTRTLTGWLGAPTNAGVYAGAAIFVVLLFVVLAVVTALVAVSVFAMPAIVTLVTARHFPDLEARHGGTFAGSMRNLVATLALFAPAWIVALLLVPVPPVYLVASWALSGWLSQRVFRYDALAEHADAAELATLPRAIRGRLLLLGILLAPLTLVPIVNLVIPLLAGIAFACLCLDELAHAREPLRA